MSVHTKMAVAILGNLPRLVAERRLARALSLRDAAAEIGIGHVTLWKLENDGEVTVTTAICVLEWLDQP